MGRLAIDAVIDIETENWDIFVCGGYYDGVDYFVSWDEDEFAEYVCEKGGNVWAWNGGLYDAIWLADWLSRKGRPFQCHFAGTRITRLSCGKLLLRDACALIPMSLQKASGMVGPEIDKDTGLICSCSMDCGGYCRITRVMLDYEREALVSYLRIDLDTTYKVLERMADHAETEDYTLTSTVGGSSWATAKQWLGIDGARWNSGRDYEFARSGYFGGRVFVGRTKAEHGYRYDINSAYPAALSTVALPYGEYAIVKGERAEKAFRRKRPGIYACTIDVPDSHLPCMPWRTPSGRIVYPVGRLEGAWSLPEIEYGQTCGVVIRKIVKAIIWSDSDVIFAPFMEAIFSTRARLGKGHALGAWQKWFGNSCTGKFAERPIKSKLIANPEPSAVRFCNPWSDDAYAKGCRPGLCSGLCGAWTPLNFDGNLWTSSHYRLSDCAHVQWAAYLTATTRIKWHRAAMAVGAENVIYGDTDSLFTLIPFPPELIGDTLGSWAYEGELFRWRCIAPKSYYYATDTKEIAKGKGLPGVDPPSWLRFADGDTIQVNRGVAGLKSAARGNSGKLFTRKQFTRSHHAPTTYIGDRRIGDDGLTGPISVRDQLARERDEQ